MTTTLTLGLRLPYPDGNELVRDGDNAIAALAQAVEAALNPPWTAIALNATFTARAGHHVPSYRVFLDGTVELRGGIDKSSNIASTNTPFTLATEARPIAIVAVPFGVSRAAVTNSAVGRLDIAATGVATVNVVDTGTTTWMSLDGISFSK